jgi:hypothetical protein
MRRKVLKINFSWISLVFLLGLQVTNVPGRMSATVPLEHADSQRFDQGHSESSAVQGEAVQPTESLVNVRDLPQTIPFPGSTDTPDQHQRCVFICRFPDIPPTFPIRTQFHNRLGGADSDPDCQS